MNTVRLKAHGLDIAAPSGVQESSFKNFMSSLDTLPAALSPLARNVALNFSN